MKPSLLSPLLLVLIFSFAVLLLVAHFGAQASVGATIGEPIQGNGESVSESVTLKLDAFAQGLSRPLGIASAGDIRLFVVEQAGKIKIIQQDGAVRSTPFLDIRGRVDASETEEGLLGLAFHPQYHHNGLFYVNYINTTGGVRRTRISSFKVSADPNIADPKSENILLTVDQPNWNHNAGKISFGPDGYLYIPLGDGGGGGDPGNNAQNTGRLLGKISRIDVDNGPGSTPDCQGLGSGDYTIPATNPLIDGSGGDCDEIWALGLRNPWQSTFDSLTGDLFVADVGQNKVEEVNFQPAASAGGENYGWRCYEGSDEYNTSGCDSAGAYTFPVFQYKRPSAYGDCSVSGGYVYRGQRYPTLYGRYFLTDYCSGRFWDLLQLPDESWQSTEHNNVEWPGPGGGSLGIGNAAFGQRCDGELFVANVIRGELYHLTAPVSPDAVSPDAVSPDAVSPDTVTADYDSTRADWITDITADSYIYLPLLAASNCR